MKEIEKNLKVILENENIDEGFLGLPTSKEELIKALADKLIETLVSNEEFIKQILNKIDFQIKVSGIKKTK